MLKLGFCQECSESWTYHYLQDPGKDAVRAGNRLREHREDPVGRCNATCGLCSRLAGGCSWSWGCDSEMTRSWNQLKETRARSSRLKSIACPDFPSLYAILGPILFSDNDLRSPGQAYLDVSFLLLKETFINFLIWTFLVAIMDWSCYFSR